jgi:hypothetical protein
MAICVFLQALADEEERQLQIRIHCQQRVLVSTISARIGKLSGVGSLHHPQNFGSLALPTLAPCHDRTALNGVVCFSLLVYSVSLLKVAAAIAGIERE